MRPCGCNLLVCLWFGWLLRLMVRSWFQVPCCSDSRRRTVGGRSLAATLQKARLSSFLKVVQTFSLCSYLILNVLSVHYTGMRAASVLAVPLSFSFFFETSGEL